MALKYRTLVVKTAASEVIEVSMSLRDYTSLRHERFETIELDDAQNAKLRSCLQELITEKKSLPKPTWPFGAALLKDGTSPFRQSPVKRKVPKANLPEEAPTQCQFGGTDAYCGRPPKKNQIYCGHHLRKAAKKHADRKMLKRSRSSTSESWGEGGEPEPNYDSLSKEPASPVKKVVLPINEGRNITWTTSEWQAVINGWATVDQ